MWAKKQAYTIDNIKKSYPPLAPEDRTSNLDGWPSANEALIQSTLASLPLGLRQRITKKREGADRSLELQKLARDLLKLKLEPNVVVHLLQRSVFNKFAGRSDEHRQLLKQVEDAAVVVASRASPAEPPTLEVPSQPLVGMTVQSWTSFLSMPTNLRWLVEDSWVDQTVGFVSGRAKSYKTWIALDLALSILSGRPFLNKFPVGRTGPVVLVQEEDPAAVLQERIKLIGSHKGMMPTAAYYPSDHKLKLEYPEYPLHTINLQGFSLSNAEKVVQVRQLIAEVNPVLVILDPLVVMLGNIDEYRATEVSGMLQTVKFWREEFGCSVAVVHHWNKTKAEEGERGGQHMYGSFAFHAWLESALHVSPVIDDQEDRIDTVLIEREFKAAPSKRVLKVKFAIDSVKKFSYEPILEQSIESPLSLKLMDLVIQGGAMTTNELVAASGYSRPRVSEAMAALVRAGKIRTERGGGRGHISKYLPPGEG
jgi:hypothetical protein